MCTARCPSSPFSAVTSPRARMSPSLRGSCSLQCRVAAPASPLACASPRASPLASPRAIGSLTARHNATSRRRLDFSAAAVSGGWHTQSPSALADTQQAHTAAPDLQHPPDSAHSTCSDPLPHLKSHAVVTGDDVEAALAVLLEPQAPAQHTKRALSQLTMALEDEELRSAAQRALCKASCAPQGAPLDVEARTTLLQALASVVATTPSGYDDSSIAQLRPEQAQGQHHNSQTNACGHSAAACGERASGAEQAHQTTPASTPPADAAPTLQKMARVAICQWASTFACIPLAGSELPGSPEQLAAEAASTAQQEPQGRSRAAEEQEAALTHSSTLSPHAAEPRAMCSAQQRDRRQRLEETFSVEQLAALPTCVANGSGDEDWMLTSTTVDAPCGIGAPSVVEAALRAAGAALQAPVWPGWTHDVPEADAQGWAVAAL